MVFAEHLLVVANEEATEVAQAIDKLLRFSPTGYNPGTPEETNEFQVLKEFAQLCAVMEMLYDFEILHPLSRSQWDNIREEKKHKVMKYLQISKNIGTLTDDT